ncbi:hypothetical protein ACFX2A_040201 [Malus domestica]
MVLLVAWKLDGESKWVVRLPSNIVLNLRYKGWLDAIRSVWRAEGAPGMFRGSIPRIAWYIPASALTFMAVEFLREHFNEGLSNENTREVASMSVEKKSKTSGKQPHCASYLLEW